MSDPTALTQPQRRTLQTISEERVVCLKDRFYTLGRVPRARQEVVDRLLVDRLARVNAEGLVVLTELGERALS